MQLSEWLRKEGIAAPQIAAAYSKRYKADISRQLMRQYVKGQPMPPLSVQKNLAKLTRNEVTEDDWKRLARKLGKAQIGPGRFRRPNGTLPKAKAKPARPGKAPKRPVSGAIA